MEALVVLGVIVVFIIILISATKGNKSVPSPEEIAHQKYLFELEFRRREQLLEEKFRSKEELLGNYLDRREDEFKQGYCRGRQWLADFIAQSKEALDKAMEDHLRTKKVPARRAADELREVQRERRQLLSKVKFLEFQLKSYEEYFPFLEEYREAIIDERFALSNEQNNLQALDQADPVKRFLDKDEYARMPPTERNQLALQRYLARSLNNWQIGRLYERFIGHGYEHLGWRVAYEGAIKGYEDFGRDLICSKGNVIKVVQCKCWSAKKVIREKHIFQLFGTTILHRKKFPDCQVIPEFYTTTKLSDEASEVAKALGVEVSNVPLEKDYPMIKCNINPRTKERIYHLPFDQQYDRVAIGNYPGECYVMTTAEAERLGFRRAFRHTNWSA